MTKTFFKTILFLLVLIGIGYSQFQTPVTVSAVSDNSTRPGDCLLYTSDAADE